ncbi:MAG: restriction endonuclease, SacI family [Rhodobacteraceae bacterium]|nr:restriction endonuclease, SacI family [Paracoccaceae bacterium]
MDNSEARVWLDKAWIRILESDPGSPDSEIDRLVNSKVLSIRYAVITQMLGKIADEHRSLLFLQMGDGKLPGAWDARSFCSAVIVPWVADNHDLLGTSPDPYVNNPLRRPRLDEGEQQLRYRNEWDALLTFLLPLDSAPAGDLKAAFVRCLASAARRLSAQSFGYQVPYRVSLPQMLRTLEAFVGEPSGGLRPLVVTAAMVSVLGRAFSIFAEVSSQGLNEADSMTGAPGDVICLDDDGKTVLAIEVKDRALTLADVRSSTRKARASSDPLSNLLFATPSVREDELGAIRQNMETAWASGLNISQIDILDLASSTFALLAEEWRPALLREIGTELDKRGDHRHRHAWHDLLSEIGGEDMT